MIPNHKLDKIIIIDFGSQFTQLIARRIREMNVFCEIVSHKEVSPTKINENVKGLILSGGPLNVYENDKFSFDKNILKKIFLFLAYVSDIKFYLNRSVVELNNLNTESSV